MENALLKGVTVLNLTASTAGSYAGWLFASEGAAVESSVQQHRTAQDRIDCELELLRRPWSIILLDELTPSPVAAQVKKHDAVIVDIVYPPGGPPTESYFQEVSGWIDMTGCPQREGLQIGGYPASFLCGAHIAFVALAGLYDKQARHPFSIRLDCMTVLLDALEGAVAKFTATGELAQRVGNRHRTLAPMCIVPSADGYVFVGAPVDEQWTLLAGWAGFDSPYDSAAMRRKHVSAVEQHIRRWAAGETAEVLVTTAQAFRLPFGYVQTVEELQHCPQLAARNFWTRQKPWRHTVAQQHQHKRLHHKSRLQQLVIADLTAMWAGPYCTRLFADLGATVIKIEAPDRPDGIRAGKGATAPFFRELNRNKQSMALNLRHSEDRLRFLQLIETSDVVVENFSPRVMENFQLQTSELMNRNDALIFASLSAFGQTGPYRNYVGYGPTIEAMGGIASETTYDGKPWLPGFSISDIAAGVHGAVAIICALLHQKKDTGFIRIDAAQYETAVRLLGLDWP